MAANVKIVSEGKSYSYLIHSSFLAIAIILLCCFHSVLWLFMLTSCILLLLFTTGVEIDQDIGRVRKYTGWLHLRWGIWLPLNHFTKVELEEFVVTKPVDSWNRFGPTSSKTFDILLIDVDDEIFELNDFFDYDKAVECFESIKLTGLKGENKYALETLKLTQRRRLQRRR